jgi:hypothetical protein
MKLFDFFRRKSTLEKGIPSQPSLTTKGNSEIPEAGFEFLITGDVNVPAEDYDQVMTPNSSEWTKLQKNGWTYYRAGEDEFSYSWEAPGIQMTFNKGISFEKAKKIAEEVIKNIKATGQEAELIMLDNSKVNRFD